MPEKNIPYNQNSDERLSGIKISDRYELKRKIATGGMADVYLGEDLKLNRRVAIKILHQAYSANKNFIARFKREAQILARLNNPNIVTVYDWGEFEDLYFIIMEYVTGESLKDIMDRKGALDPKLAAKYSIQICMALESAHNNGLIHRDIKPQNILITDDDAVKVADFGIAKSIAEDVTKTLSVVGTAHYISPEQAQGKLLDNKTDIYSLGVLMYEMLTADLPFRGGSSIDISLRHISEKPQPPSRVFPGIPSDFEKIILKCLEKSPSDRYQTVVELEKDIKNFIEGKQLNIEGEYKNGYRRKPRAPYYIGAGQYGEIFEGYKKRNKKIIIGLLTTSVVLLIIFLTVLSFFIPANNRYNQLINAPVLVMVPPVENINADAAKAILSTSGLSMVINGSYPSDTIPINYIIQQKPAAYTKVNIDSNIEVVVSMGPETIMESIPNLAGLDIDDAKDSAEKSGFKIGQIREEYSNSAEEKTIISQYPEYGQLEQAGMEIDIVISRGIEMISIPNLIGYDYEYVRTNIESLGLNVVAERKSNTDYISGTVIDIYPSPGAEVKKGETIKIYISTPEALAIVPDMVSMSLQQAEDMLAELDIRYEINYIEVDYSIQKNSVISQYPEADSQIFPGDSIILFVGE